MRVYSHFLELGVAYPHFPGAWQKITLTVPQHTLVFLSKDMGVTGGEGYGLGRGGGHGPKKLRTTASALTL